MIDRSPFDLVAAPVVVLDREGRIRFVNRRFEQETDRREADLAGLPFWEAVAAPGARQAVAEAFASNAGRAFELVCEWLPATGEPLDMKWSFMPAPDGGSVGTAEFEREARSLAELSTALAKSMPVEEISRLVLESARRLTGSPIGFAGYFEGAALVCPAIALDGGAPTSGRMNATAGLIDAIARRPEAVVSDAPAEGLHLQGHVPVSRFAAVPCISGDTLVGVIGLANAGVPYTAADRSRLERLATLFAVSVARQRTEDALREAHERLRAVFDAAPSAIVGFDAGERVTVWNSAAETLFGWRAAEVIGLPLPIFPAERPPQMKEKLARLMAGENIPAYEGRPLRQDGSSVAASISAVPVRNRRGEVTGFMAVYRDLTERKRMEAGLAETERRLKTLVDNLPGAAFRCRAGERLAIEYVSGGAFDLSGYTADELTALPRPIETLVAAEDLPAVRASIARATEGRHSFTSEFRLRTKDGALKWVWAKGAVFEADAILFIEGLIVDISQRRQAEQALADTAEQYRLLFESNPHPMWVFDAQTLRFLAVNEAAVVHYGYSRDEFLAMDITHIRPAEAVSELLADLARVHRDIDSSRLLWRHRRKDGSEIEVRITSVGLVYAGRPARLVLAHDDTARIRAERARRESEQRYRDLFENAPIGIYRTTPDGRILLANPALCRMLGYAGTEELSRRNLENDGFEPDYSRAEFKARLEAEGEIRGHEAAWRRPDGSTIVVRENARAIRSAEGAVVYEGVVEDITGRKQAEEAVRASEARFRAIFEGASTGILIVALDGKVVDANPAAEAMLGFPAGAMRGIDVGAFALPEDGAGLASAVAEMASGRCARFNAELPLARRDRGLMWGRVGLSPLRDANGDARFLIAMIDDVTERKQAEEELRRTAEDLARSNAELQEFAYVASHDLQEPLRMVTSFVQLLKKRYAASLDPEACEFIDFAVGGTTRMKTLIDDLLTYSRFKARSRPFRMTDAGGALRQALSNLSVAVDEAGALVECGELPVLAADAGQLVQLFQNLLGNAVKFRGTQAPRVCVSAERCGAEWVFSLADNGIGIEPQHRERIFEAFHRLHTKSEYPGSGIGLAVCKKIVERHGGRIWTEAAPQGGSVFRFTIPDLPCGE